VESSGQDRCVLVGVEPRRAMTVHLAHYAEIFSRGQQSSLFSIFLAKEDWSKLTVHELGAIEPVILGRI
jgi:hypothetical protein